MSAQPQARSLPYIRSESGAIAFRGERAGEVRIPNYVYDLWMPLLGATTIGIYATYTRLQRNRLIWGMTMDELARACRVGKATLQSVNRTLAECGFIAVKAPASYRRYKHYTLEIMVNDAPCEVPPVIQQKYAHPQGYVPLTHWLVQSEDELLNRPDRTSGSSENDSNRPTGTVKIASYIASSYMDQSLDLTNTTGIVLGGADAPPPVDQVLVDEKKAESLKQESKTPELRIVPKPAQSKSASNAGNPPIPQPPLKAKPAPVDMSPEAARTARTPAELAFEKLCFGSQFTAWDNDISRGKMRTAMNAIQNCDPLPLTAARIEDAGRWWYAGGSWIGRRKGERPEPSQLAGKWASFMAGVYESEPPTIAPVAPSLSSGETYEEYFDRMDDNPFQKTKAEIERDNRIATVPAGVRDVWLAQLGQLQVQLNRATYNTWLGRAKLIDHEFAEGTHSVYIEVPHIYAADWLEKNLKDSMTRNFEQLWSLSKLETGKIELVFEVAE